jgi:hypothetical protein
MTESTGPRTPEVEGENRQPFVAPTVEDLGTLTVVTQQTIIFEP